MARRRRQPSPERKARRKQIRAAKLAALADGTLVKTGYSKAKTAAPQKADAVANWTRPWLPEEADDTEAADKARAHHLKTRTHTGSEDHHTKTREKARQGWTSGDCLAGPVEGKPDKTSLRSGDKDPNDHTPHDEKQWVVPNRDRRVLRDRYAGSIWGKPLIIKSDGPAQFIIKDWDKAQWLIMPGQRIGGMPIPGVRNDPTPASSKSTLRNWWRSADYQVKDPRR